ncbi:Ubiquitin family protein [Trichomonas vaginalis G3]|uniref:Ubiquitin family protein n=1 Tax=Trichomonas vaginalis (strain ATCC PRA-98 / G3) TaxID=412133 RepID=A2G588_TRIV3|nr:Rad23 protein ubiquitin-like (Ubl) domain-containing protein [Trichomonas vaginalis G3]EAX87680.1 Ubiquitin family protein [Trichomonas vaginalis G3]KAI5520394.1 Rad23 protein ubiquitin-like (Ubl) domain-containing protein [Trichomonas vaginalis G3]|eukprot:XP_001300610.1 Ubiquitin family protein [Trichomonas vaginalis G3]
MKVAIKTISNKTYDIDIETSKNVLDLKKALEQKFSIELKQINLIYHRKILRDDQTLESLNYKPNEFIILHKQVNGANILEPKKVNPSRKDMDRKNRSKHSLDYPPGSFPPESTLVDFDAEEESSNMEEELGSDQSESEQYSETETGDNDFYNNLSLEGKKVFNTFEKKGYGEDKFKELFEKCGSSYENMKKKYFELFGEQYPAFDS